MATLTAPAPGIDQTLTTSHAASSPSVPAHPAGTTTSAATTTPVRPSALNVSVPDEDVLMAARALGDMKNQRISPTSAGATQNSPTLIDPLSSSPDQHTRNGSGEYAPSNGIANGEYGAPDSGGAGTPTSSQQQPPDFVSRVSSHFPIVNTALRAYESSKNSSRVVKLGAEMVESSLATLSRPVMERLPVAQMDGFACRQLDKLEGRSRSYSGSQPTGAASASDAPPRDWEVNTPTSMKAMYKHHDNPSSMSVDTQGTYSSETLPPLSPSTTRDRDMDAPQQLSRAGWGQTMLVGAGGLSAAVSEENMRRLQLCLDWLRWATRITDTQVAILRNFLAALALPPPHPESSPISPQAARTLAEAQSGVVDAIKKVVSVVSSYAGSALPEPARGHVRQWILDLPARWRAATAAQRAQPPQTIMTPDGELPSYTAAKSMAQKVLALAIESLDMLRNLTGAFDSSLESARTWLDRFGRNRPGLPPPQSAVSSGTTTPTVAHPPHGAYTWPADQKQDSYAHGGYYGYSQPHQGQGGYGYEKDGRDGQGHGMSR